MNNLTFNLYQSVARQTAIYDGQGSVKGLSYAALGLTGEAGEIANKVKKVIRDGNDDYEAIAKELGDVANGNDRGG
jgi:NTP pyrophosphatase (non-canonical NTP hydrolase)